MVAGADMDIIWVDSLVHLGGNRAGFGDSLGDGPFPFQQILEARCAMVNCIPVFIAKEEYWSKRFEERGVPIVGDDIKSQLGATITHRVLTRLFEDRAGEF